MTGIAGLWGIDTGSDFAAGFVRGLLDRMAGRPPEHLARIRIIVPTRAIQRRIAEALHDGTARLLPRIELLDDLAADPRLAAPPVETSLARILTLARLVSRLIATEPALAAPSAVFDLARSLSDLLDEMQAEGVTPDRLEAIDVADNAAHWQATLRFLSILGTAVADGMTGPEGQLRAALQDLIRLWAGTPPPDPIIVAGSTGSRAPSRLLIQAVLRLPQGAVVLPGFDFDAPSHAWAALGDARTGEDHPQFRFARLLGDLAANAGDVRRWHAGPRDASRARLISLALRPAPVTDQWLAEGPCLGDPVETSAGLTLIEAADPRSEAAAIACAMRDALEQGLSATLVTPDRQLGRRVAAVLDGWNLRADDSAGRPLSQTAPGRFLRHVAEMLANRMTAESLVVLLKHPLTHVGTDRGPHLMCTREIELSLRRSGPPYPDAAALSAWATGLRAPQGAVAWAQWLGDALPAAPVVGTRALTELTAQHLALAETLSAGAHGHPSELWAGAAGTAARTAMDGLVAAAGSGAAMTAHDYGRLLEMILGGAQVPDDVPSHPGLRIRGPREARSETADLMILAGLNDGTWPAVPAPDPWMSRGMRLAAGLLLPERQIGLSAHDFQIAVGAPRVILSRSRRDDSSETVPSRWLNRLTNLMAGLPGGWPEALVAMRARGNRWLALSSALSRPDAPVMPERRPAPAPPPSARPRQLSITQIQTLIRDPYAIYARHVLRLRTLDPLTRGPDPRDRGTLLHSVLQSLVNAVPHDEAAFADALVALAAERLEAEVPWPATRRLWLARLRSAAPEIAAGETERRDAGTPRRLEAEAALDLPEAGFRLIGKIDRVDSTPEGAYLIYDYKSGDPPTKKVQTHFDRQLALSALCVAQGGVADLPPGPVAGGAFLSLSPGAKVAQADPQSLDPAATRTALVSLLSAWVDPDRGYVSRRAIQRTMNGDAGDYDHLARYGEWAQSDDPAVTGVGR
jgi:double-strand break repair protein AddB